MKLVIKERTANVYNMIQITLMIITENPLFG